jgi:hypothetical protein
MKTLFIATAMALLLFGCGESQSADTSQAPADTYVAPTPSAPAESTTKVISSQPASTDVPKCEPVKKAKAAVVKHPKAKKAAQRHHKAVVAAPCDCTKPAAAVVPAPAEADQCSRTGGWWNTAVPYCEYQNP